MKFLIKYIIRIAANAAVLYFATEFLPGVSVGNDIWIAVTVIFILSVYNAFVRPIVRLITLPLNILTLGIFAFISNILVLFLISSFVEGFVIDNFLSAAILSIILAVANSILDVFLK